MMDTELTWPKHVTMPRWFSVCLILAVFLLPLHFHATSAIASQITKECSCFHGTRTQLAIAPDVPQLTLQNELPGVIIDKEFSSSKTWSDPQKVRGPPPVTPQ
jgi:hypothetical protein